MYPLCPGMSVSAKNKTNSDTREGARLLWVIMCGCLGATTVSVAWDYRFTVLLHSKPNQRQLCVWTDSVVTNHASGRNASSVLRCIMHLRLFGAWGIKRPRLFGAWCKAPRLFGAQCKRTVTNFCNCNLELQLLAQLVLFKCNKLHLLPLQQMRGTI